MLEFVVVTALVAVAYVLGKATARGSSSSSEYASAWPDAAVRIAFFAFAAITFVVMQNDGCPQVIVYPDQQEEATQRE